MANKIIDFAETLGVKYLAIGFNMRNGQPGADATVSSRGPSREILKICRSVELRLVPYHFNEIVEGRAD